MVTHSENMSQANFDLGIDDTITVEENGVKILRNPVLSFMHAWYMGDDANSIMRNAMTSFSNDQLEEVIIIIDHDDLTDLLRRI